MPPPSPLPKYIYKILSSPPPTPLPTTFPPFSDLDRTDGFIHLSTAAQVPLTANRFFGTAHSLTLLKVRLVGGNPSVLDKTKWELPPGVVVAAVDDDDDGKEKKESQFFPHLYGTLGKEDVESVRTFERGSREGAEESWLDVLVREEWLE